MTPFDYPPVPLVRRHGPRGYRDLESFRPWLRDEFTFRCVFCLRREQWDRATTLHIDHFLPASLAPNAERLYDNLLYACAACNLTKAGQATPDPTVVLTDSAVSIDADGRIFARAPEALRLIEQLRLNRPELIHFRRLWLEIIALADRSDPRLYEELMGFPDDLPDLRALKPPEGNTRPAGIDSSFRARRDRNELDRSY